MSAVQSPLVRRLQEMRERYQQLQASLNDPSVLSNPQLLVPASREAGRLEPIVTEFDQYLKARQSVEDLKKMAGDQKDPEMAQLAGAELSSAQTEETRLLDSLTDQLLAAEDNAVDSFFLEIRAGTGGEEAALFARDLYEMYRRYVETKKWRFDVSDFSTSDRGGFKEMIVNIRGPGAFRRLRFEGGGHRVQRVPETEAQGASTPAPQPWRSSPKCPTSKLKSIRKTSKSSAAEAAAPAGKTSTKSKPAGEFSTNPPACNSK